MSGAPASTSPLLARIAAATTPSTDGMAAGGPLPASSAPGAAGGAAGDVATPAAQQATGYDPRKVQVPFTGVTLPRPIPQTPRQQRRPDGATPTIGQRAISLANDVMYGKGVLDGYRVYLKLGEAKAAGLHGTAIRQMLTAAPTTTILNPDFPAVGDTASRGLSFTARDGKLYAASMGIGGVIAGVQFGSGLFNAADGIRQDGVAGLGDTKAGRSGVLQLLAGGLPLSLMGVAGTSAFLDGARGMGVLKAATGAGMLSRPWVGGVSFAATGLTMLNEWGYFDSLDRGETRSFGDVMQDAAHNTPILGWMVDKSDAGKAKDAAAAAKAQQAHDAQFDATMSHVMDVGAGEQRREALARIAAGS